MSPPKSVNEINRRFTALAEARKEHQAELLFHFENETIAASPKIEEMMVRENLSENDKRYVRGYVNYGWVPAASLDLSKPLRDGDMGVPSYFSIIGTTSSVAVDRIVSKDEMVVWNGKLLVKGISTAGLIDTDSLGDKPGLPSVIDLKAGVFVDGIMPCTTSSGKVMTIPRLYAIDIKKVDLALDSAEVRKWADAKVAYQQALAESERQAKEEYQQMTIELAAAKVEQVRIDREALASTQPALKEDPAKQFALQQSSSTVSNPVASSPVASNPGVNAPSASGGGFASSSTINYRHKTEYVQGYHRANGTYVEPYHRAASGMGTGPSRPRK